MTMSCEDELLVLKPSSLSGLWLAPFPVSVDLAEEETDVLLSPPQGSPDSPVLP
jgi:hypothetical protein